VTGLDAEDGEDCPVEALGGGEVRDGEADVVEHPVEATVAGMLDSPPAEAALASELRAVITDAAGNRRTLSRRVTLRR
jgi:hypothetical protein